MKIRRVIMRGSTCRTFQLSPSPSTPFTQSTQPRLPRGTENNGLFLYVNRREFCHFLFLLPCCIEQGINPVGGPERGVIGKSMKIVPIASEAVWYHTTLWDSVQPRAKRGGSDTVERPESIGHWGRGVEGPPKSRQKEMHINPG